MSDKFWSTTNIKVAAAEAAHGVVLRQCDPVTHIIKEDGTRQVSFHFEDSPLSQEIKNKMECRWDELDQVKDESIALVRAALENRDTLVGLVKRAEPIRVIKRNNKIIFFAENASTETKQKILRSI